MISSTRLISAILVFICLSCNNKKENNESSIPVDRSIKNNDVSINYQVYGEGNYTLFFIHGWCIDGSYWSDQIEPFKSDYQIVTIDLPGFHNANFTRKDWTIESYSSDVNAVINELQLKNIILIGHSMGGEIMLETALQNDNVIALIGVDNFKDMGLEITEELKKGVDEFFTLLESNYAEISEAYAEGNLFASSTDSLINARVISDISSADSLVAISSLKNLFNYFYNEGSKLSQLNQKLYLINSNTSPTNLDNIAELGVKCELLEIDSTGHYPMIEKPDEFNKLLKTTIESIVSSQKN